MRFILSMLTIFTLGLGVLTACQDTTAPNRTEQAKTNASPTNASPAATAKTDDHADTAPRITLAEAKTHFDADDAVFVDTRAAEAYNLERIKGAINITPNNVETMYKNLPKDKKIIVYCSWPNEHTSAGLVQQLKEKGFNNAYALLGGTRAWKEAGYPMEGNQHSK